MTSFLTATSNTLMFCTKYYLQTLYIHGDMDHSDRKVNFKGFEKATDGALLICTDVASRGLDFKGVEWIL